MTTAVVTDVSGSEDTMTIEELTTYMASGTVQLQSRLKTVDGAGRVGSLSVADLRAIAEGTQTLNSDTSIETIGTGGDRIRLTQTALFALINGASTLAALTLSANTFDADDAQGTLVGNIVSKTAGSLVTLSALSTAGALQVSGTRLEVGPTPLNAPDSLTFNLVETLAGAVGSPKSTAKTATETCTLNVLTLSADTFPAASPEDTVIGAIVGGREGSSIAISAINPVGCVKKTGNNILTGATPATGTFTLTETLAGAVGTPKATAGIAVTAV